MIGRRERSALAAAPLGNREEEADYKAEEWRNMVEELGMNEENDEFLVAEPCTNCQMG